MLFSIVIFYLLYLSTLCNFRARIKIVVVPKSNVTLQLTLSCASAFHMWTVFGGIICAYTQFSIRVFVAGNCMATCRPIAFSIEKLREILKREKTKSVLFIHWRSISDKQRKKEQERVRVNRQSISDKQREKTRKSTSKQAELY